MSEIFVVPPYLVCTKVYPRFIFVVPLCTGNEEPLNLATGRPTYQSSDYPQDGGGSYLSANAVGM